MENENKLAKIKAAVNLCQNTDPTREVVRGFEEASVKSVHHSLHCKRRGITPRFEAGRG